MSGPNSVLIRARPSASVKISRIRASSRAGSVIGGAVHAGSEGHFSGDHDLNHLAAVTRATPRWIGD